ncbi:MAG TPA: patatin-like phospholipase family protein [Nitrososphaeraceae archaeon]|nr:patatin-like phospholipase family protein [Nitrososphaeraceae archaeon]
MNNINKKTSNNDKYLNNTIDRKTPVENVLVLQGGGSLGAFACGAYKALLRKNLKFDIIAGTSIGAINGAIIAGSKNNNPAQDLEDFWLELAESSYTIIPDMITFDYDDKTKVTKLKTIPSASLNAAFYGVPKMFVPRWFQTNISNNSNNINDKNSFIQWLPWNWTYIYDNSALGKTLEKYIDFKKLSLHDQSEIKDRGMNSNYSSSSSSENIRLIVTAVNVLNSKPLIFDSFKMQIQLKHLLASVGYPNYGFSWVEVEDGVYGWDGSLLSNTPMREVILQSPSNDKNIFIVENYSKKINELPSDMTEVQARIKDILYGDKTESFRQISKLLTRHLELIENMYNELEFSKMNTKKADYIKKEYQQLVHKYGAKILNITKISRGNTESPYPLQNADFSIHTVKSLIKEGEDNAMKVLE